MLHFPYISKFNDRQSKFAFPRSTRESVLVTALWTLSLLIIALPNGISSRIGSIGLKNSATSFEIRKAWGSGDAGSLLDAARTWAHGHQLNETTQFWIVHLWSPGMSILEIPLIWLEKLGIPLFWSLLSITVLLWNSIFYLAWKYGSVLIGRITLSLVALLLIFSWDFRYMFRDDLFYTEGIGYGLLFLGLLIASWMVLVTKYENSRRLTLLAGVCIGTSIWIRHVSDSGLMLFTVLTSTLFLWRWKFSKEARNARQPKGRYKKNSKSKLKNSERLTLLWHNLGALPYVTLSAWIGLLITVPWRIISPLLFKGWLGVMSSASADLPFAIWAPNNSPTGKYWASSGMNWACNIDKVTCSTLNLSLHTPKNASHLTMEAIRAAVTHPFAYIQNRTNFAYKNWIPNGMHTPPNLQTIVAFLSFVVLIFSIYLYVQVRDERKRLLALIWGPFLVMQLFQFSIIHYESRYFIPIRILGVGFALTLLALNSNQTKRSDENLPPRVIL